MSFAWSPVLAGLLAVPILVGTYVVLLRRRRRRAVLHSDVALLRAARPARATWRRHIPVALVAAALAALTAGAARPQTTVDVPISQAAVILAVDVSGSMCATDVEPNRLSAAQSAVREFVRTQDAQTRIGLVVFSGFAQLAVPPTTDRDDVLQAIDAMTTGRGTTIGAAILKSVEAISAIDQAVSPPDTAQADALRPEQLPGSGSAPSEPSGSGQGPAPGGAAGATGYAPEIVVLLTDGANTRGISPVDAARQAAARGVRVYPIGFGTTNPTTLSCTAKQLGGMGFDAFRGPPGAGAGGVGANFLVADVPTLQQVAKITGGTYFSASRTEELQQVFTELPRHVERVQRTVEVTVWLVALGVALLLGAVAAAVRWSAFPG